MEQDINEFDALIDEIEITEPNEPQLPIEPQLPNDQVWTARKNAYSATLLPYQVIVGDSYITATVESYESSNDSVSDDMDITMDITRLNQDIVISISNSLTPSAIANESIPRTLKEHINSLTS
jgi:hypothetical protein